MHIVMITISSNQGDREVGFPGRGKSQYIANKEHGHGRAATRAPSPRPHPPPPLLYTKLSQAASSYSRGERGGCLGDRDEERLGGPLWSPVPYVHCIALPYVKCIGPCSRPSLMCSYRALPLAA